jgi:hypothetical protein
MNESNLLALMERLRQKVVNAELKQKPFEVIETSKTYVKYCVN